MVFELECQLGRAGVRDAQHYEGLDIFAFDLIRTPDDRGFGDCGMAYQSAFYIGGANAVASDVEYVICASYDGEVAVFIADSYISRGVSIRYFAPVLGIAFRIAIHCAEHVREGPPQHQESAFVGWHLVALRVHDFSHHAR